MSGITGISVAARQIPQAAVAVAAAAGVAALSQGSGRDTAGPAVIMSLSSAATASTAKASPALRSMDPTAVEDALAMVGAANGAAFIAAHFDEAYVVSKIGTADAERAQDVVTGAANVNASIAIDAVQHLGLPVNDPVGSIGANVGPGTGTSGYFTVSDFSFTSGKSTYSITTGANGMLTGTKDGQYWTALDMIPSEWYPPSQPTTPPLTPAQATGKAAWDASVQAARMPVTYYIADGLGGAPASAASAGSAPTAVADRLSNGLASTGSSVVTSVAQTGEADAVSGVTASSTGSSLASQLLTTGQSGNMTSITPAEAGAEAALTTLTAFEAQRTSADKTAAAQSLSSPADAGAEAAQTILTAFNAQKTSADTTAAGQSLSSLNLLI